MSSELGELKAIKDKTTNPICIAFALVTYNENYLYTSSYISITQSLQSTYDVKHQFYIYDNSNQENWYVEPELKDCYFRNEKNPGLSVAYNFLVSKAQMDGYEWIVLLDQDTWFPQNAVLEYVKGIESSNNIYLKCPIVLTQDGVFSPLRYFFIKSFYSPSIPSGLYKISKYKIINSGLLVNINFFLRIGGYNEKVKVDFSDVDFIKKAGKQLKMFEVLPIICKQQFSFYNDDKKKAIMRYKTYLMDHYNCEKNTLFDWIEYALVDIIHLKNLIKRHKSLSFAKVYMLHVFKNIL